MPIDNFSEDLLEKASIYFSKLYEDELSLEEAEILLLSLLSLYKSFEE